MTVFALVKDRAFWAKAVAPSSIVRGAAIPFWYFGITDAADSAAASTAACPWLRT